MTRLNYELTTSKYNFTCHINFNKRIPQFILDLSQNAIEANQRINEYISSKGIRENTDLFKIVQRSFKHYPEVLFYDLNALKTLIQNGYITQSENITGSINSLKPVVNKFTMLVDNKEWNMYNEDDIDEVLIEMMEDKYPEGFEFRVSNYVKSDITEQQEVVQFEIKNNTLYCKGDEVSEDHIDYETLSESNNIPFMWNAGEGENIENGFVFVKEGDGDIIKEYDGTYYSYDIKDSSIVFNQYKNWHDLLMVKTNIIRQSEFREDTSLYQIIYHDYLENGIALNKFIFLAFIKNEDDIRKQLIASSRVSSWIQDEAIMRNLLLIDEDFKMPDNINIQYAEKILQNASLEQISIIMRKLSINHRDAMLSPKLLNRLSSIDKNYLSPKQLKIVQDEEAKKQLVIDEYHTVIGKITNLGIREKMKSLTKKELKEFGGKNTKQWLDKNIGHNKGNQEITESLLNKAKDILKRFENINK